MSNSRRDQSLTVEWTDYTGVASPVRYEIKGWSDRWQAIARTELGHPPGWVALTIDGSFVIRGLTQEEAEYIRGENEQRDMSHV